MNKYKKEGVMQSMIKIIFLALKETPKFMGLMFVVGIISALFQGGITIQTHRMLDAASKTFGSDDWMIRTAVQGGVLCLVTITAQLLNGVHNYSYDIFINKMKNKFRRRINDSIKGINPTRFEDSEFLNLLQKSKVGMESGIEVVLVIQDIFTYYLPYFIFMGIYLFKVNPLFLLMMILIFIPVFASQIIRMRIFGELEEESAVLQRKMDHYDRCMSDIRYLKETRAFGAVGYFKNKFIYVLKKYNRNITKSNMKANNYEMILDCITLGGYILVIWMLVSSMINRSISVAAFGAIYASISTMFSMMEEIIRYNIGNISEQMGSVQSFLKIIDHEKIHHGDGEIFDEGIEFKDVKFRYPNGKSDVIKGVNLHIKSGETIALVGGNGAGKSTLANLLLGIYEPTEGEIFIDGKKRVKNHFNFSNKSALFQKFKRYKLSLDDNIRIGNFKSNAKVEVAAQEGSIKDLYESEKDTVLAVEFGGIDLSGGQWQRVSLARALYKESRLMILDEPTASIDALEEDMMYSKFKEISKDKTTIIVTHHLGSVSFADRIFVMDEGDIVEMGTHKDLIKREGLYEKMFNAQYEGYIKV